MNLSDKEIREFLNDIKFQGHYSKKGVIKYANLIMSFDIETTNTYYNNEKISFMYIWQVYLINGEKEVFIYGRTWQEFNHLLDLIHKKLLLTNKKKCFIWIHNLSFEFQFMRKEIKGEWDIFASEERKPYKAEINDFVFRDTLILSGMSLERTAKNLTKHKIEKLKGELDYNLIRHFSTEITQQELQYCLHDVQIVAYYISEQKDIYNNQLSHIPLTNTGRVRRYMKECCFHSGGKGSHKKDSKGKAIRFKELMSYLTLDVDQYKILVTAFQGGFTHANPSWVNMVIDNVHSIDFTSSYPAVMLSEKFPMSSLEKIEVKSLQEYDKLNHSETGYLMIIELTNVISKITYDNYLSESRMITKVNPSVNNGRIYAADNLIFSCVDIDLNIIREVYEFETITFHTVYKYYMTYLPTSIIKGVLKLYDDKTKLKGIEGKEVEYLISKGMLNSTYGMCVTAIVRDEVTYNGDNWNKEKSEAEKQINDYNENKTRFLFYPWGVYITAYARRNLWKGITHFKDDYIYSDTDSIKFINIEKHKEWIEKYNKDIIKKINNCLEYCGINYNFVKPLGVWDYEGKYDKFKTLGAKRYMILKDGKYKITIAGLSKQNGAEYISKQKNPFDFFNDEMYIPADHTGKLTHTYIDDFMECDIIDYKGNKEHIEVNSCVHLEKCDFTLSQSIAFKNFLEQLLKGQLILSMA